MKKCTICKKEFPATKDYFNVTKQIKSGLQSQCHACHNKKVREWKKKNPDKIKKYQKNYQENSIKLYGAANRRYHLKKSYGISIDDFKASELSQGHRCAICGKHKEENKKGLFLDHCHETRQNRGLLCSVCNSLVGFAKDDPKILKNAIQYLENPPGIIKATQEK